MHKNTCPLSNQTGGWGASLPPECNCGWNIRQDTGAPEKEGWRCNFCIKHTSCVGLNADGKPVITCPHECHQTKEEGEYNYACSCGTKRWKQGKNKSLGRGDGKDSCADCQKWLNGSPKEAGWEEAKKYFEANLLDGDDIKACGGAMIDAEECWEVVKDLLETTREECAIENSTKCNKAITSAVEECKEGIREKIDKEVYEFAIKLAAEGNPDGYYFRDKIIQLIGE